MSHIYALECHYTDCYGPPHFINRHPPAMSPNFYSLPHGPQNKVAPMLNATQGSPATSVSAKCTSLSASTSSLSSDKTSPDETSVIVPSKENNPLPHINHEKMSDPQDVVDRNSKLLSKNKLPTLAVRLAKESYFGPEIMIRCTIRGIGSHHALPCIELDQLKKFLCSLALPRFVKRNVEFEEVWKLCINAIGQACKQYRIDAAATAAGKKVAV